MAGDRRPTLVVDPTVADHLEVLGLTAVGGVGVIEQVGHGDAVERLLFEAVDHGRFGKMGHIEHGRGHVDDVVELVADLALGGEPVGPVDDGAVAGAPEVGGDLLGPLVGGAHGVGPAHRVVVVRLGGAELVDVGRHELGGLERRRAVQREQLVEGAVGRALGAGPVVADDVVDQRVVEDLELLERVDDPPDGMVGVLQESGVDLHLAGQDRLQDVRHVVPGLDLLGPGGELGVGRDHPQLLLPGEDLLPQRVPAGVEAALVLVRPLRGHVVGGVGGTRGVSRRRRACRSGGPVAGGSRRSPCRSCRR